ncbi:MAG: PfkB family carbohydrate kinase, partial [Planctomycetota bacterium]|nr:PfkB family carbohydrate kinase [Planctomycetota bacterium]
MARTWDVVGIGCVSVDDLVFVPAWPAADTKLQVPRIERHFGGLTATALVAAARLGARCAFAGRLGTDALSDAVAANLLAHGIDVAHAPRSADYGVVHACIVVGNQPPTRNIFFHVPGKTGAHEDLPSAEVIAGAKVLFIDWHGMAGNLRAVRLARQHGTAVVADIEGEDQPLMREVLALVDHVVMSHDFAAQITGKTAPAAAAQALWAPGRAAVVVTAGAEGCWWLDGAGSTPRHQPAFRVEVVDTTGCGDVFHGAYAAALAEGL